MTEEIPGLCGDEVHRARCWALVVWPADPLVGPVCDQDREAVTAYLRRKQKESP